MKKFFILLLSVLMLSSCEIVNKPTPENVYNFYTSCAKGDTESVKQFLTDFPDSADIEIFSDKKDKTNNYTYQRFAYFLINEKLVTFSEEEKDEEQKFIREYKRYPIHIAARYGYLDIVKLLIEHNSNVNIKSDHDYTPLLYAVNREYLDIIKELINNKANIDQKNDEDLTPLAFAIYWNKDISIIKELITSGADIEMTSQTYTPLMLAASNNNKEIMELLIENGANINAKTENGQTAFELCAIDGNNIAIDVLLKHGVNINEQGTNGNTALMSAAGTENFELVKYLINAGADIKIKNTLGYNALDFAVAAYEQNKKSFQIIDYLERKGLKCNVVDLAQYRKQNAKSSTQTVAINQTQKTTEKDFKYKLTNDGNGVVITKYIGTNKWIDIPKEIEGFPVREIGQYESIFSDTKTIYEKLTIPDSVTIIKDSAFKNSKIKKIYIPESVSSIELSALDDIDYLEELILPSRLDANSFYITFAANANLKEVVIPNSTRPSYNVGVYTRDYGKSSSTVKKIIFSNGINYVQIGGNLKNIEQIELPDTLEYFTGRVLLYPSNKFIMPNKTLKFNYKSVFSSHPQEFAPYIIDNCTLKERKDIQDFWRNLGYDGYFAEESIF